MFKILSYLRAVTTVKTETTFSCIFFLLLLLFDITKHIVDFLHFASQHKMLVRQSVPTGKCQIIA